MRCPFCKEDSDRVVDSRSSDAGRAIRRRRECLACRRRFTTYEKVQDNGRLVVVKKDQQRVPYDRDKVVGSIEKACYKRPVSAEQIQQVADRTEEYLLHRYDKEVPSTVIGEQVMKHLRLVDRIAYVRFVSISRDFASADDLLNEVRHTLEQAEPVEQLRLFEET